MTTETLKKIAECRDKINEACTKPYTADSDGGLPGQLTSFNWIADHLQTYGGSTNFEDSLISDLKKLNGGFEALIEKTKRLNEIFVDLVDNQTNTNR